MNHLATEPNERKYLCVGCDRWMPVRFMDQTARETDADPDLGYCSSYAEHDRVDSQ